MSFVAFTSRPGSVLLLLLPSYPMPCVSARTSGVVIHIRSLAPGWCLAWEHCVCAGMQFMDASDRSLCLLELMLHCMHLFLQRCVEATMPLLSGNACKHRLSILQAHLQGYSHVRWYRHTGHRTCTAHAQMYAADQQQFFKDFSYAYVKLTTLGAKWKPLVHA